MDILLYIIIGVLIGGFCLYFYLRPKLLVSKELNESIIKTNKQLEKDYNSNLKLLEKIKSEIKAIEANKTDIQLDIEILKEREQSVKNNIENLEDYFNNVSKAMYQKSYDLASAKMELSAEKLSEEFQQAQENVKQEYLNTLTDCVKDFTFEIENKQKELNKIKNQLKDIQNKVDNAVEAAKRAEELRQEKDFYKLQLSDIDIQEIEKLREVAPYLRDSEPLNKVIWKVYYEKPYSDLIGRIIGNNVYSGIYKITNIENEMCYVGQAVNIADRWKQHIKRGIGAETPTKNKLYPAMQKYGVENFTFEVIEKCDKKLLNEREDYWQEFFHAKDFGYSIK